MQISASRSAHDFSPLLESVSCILGFACNDKTDYLCVMKYRSNRTGHTEHRTRCRLVLMRVWNIVSYSDIKFAPWVLISPVFFLISTHAISWAEMRQMYYHPYVWMNEWIWLASLGPSQGQSAASITCVLRSHHILKAAFPRLYVACTPVFHYSFQIWQSSRFHRGHISSIFWLDCLI